jgi:deoxycytidylate deaminase
MIINAQINRVVAGEAYADDLGTRLLKEAGVQLELFKPKVE